MSPSLEDFAYPVSERPCGDPRPHERHGAHAVYGVLIECPGVVLPPSSASPQASV